MLTLYLSPGFISTAPHIAFHGKVPTLLVDGRPLTEVAAILYYLAKRFPAADLFPADNPEGQA